MAFIDDKQTVSESSVPIKPRRTKGTYSYKFRNYFASAVIGVGILSGIIFMYLPVTKKAREQLKKHMQETEEAKHNAQLMTTFGAGFTSEGIRKIMENVQVFEAKKPPQQ